MGLKLGDTHVAISFSHSLCHQLRQQMKAACLVQDMVMPSKPQAPNTKTDKLWRTNPKPQDLKPEV